MSFRLGRVTVSRALADGLEESIAQVTQLTAHTVVRRLRSCTGSMHVRNAFGDEWPWSGEDLADFRVAFARDWGLHEEIFACTGLSPSTVTRRLNGQSGVKLLRNAFPELLEGEQDYEDEDEDDEDDEDEEEVAPPQDVDDDPTDGAEPGGPTLERRRVAAVRDDPSAIEELSALVGLSPRAVQARLRSAHGAKLVRNVFADVWPVPVDGSNDENSSAGAGPRVFMGRWEVVRRLGTGGFGTAYEVRDLKNPQLEHCVLKVARASVGVDVLRGELGIALGLHHQNICPYRHIDEDPVHGTFIVMAHGGESLSDLIERGERFDLATIFDVVRQVAAGLDAAHEKLVLHQDVKPANILVTPRSRGRLQVWISDFGISLVGRSTVQAGRSTVVADTPKGFTFAYGAPEQVEGREVSRRSDQYSLAMVCCAMLEGRDFDRRCVPGPFEALSQRQNRAIKRALSRDPERRFESCSAFAEAVATP